MNLVVACGTSCRVTAFLVAAGSGFRGCPGHGELRPLDSGIEPITTASEGRFLNHWTPGKLLFIYLIIYFISVDSCTLVGLPHITVYFGLSSSTLLFILSIKPFQSS